MLHKNKSWKPILWPDNNAFFNPCLTPTLPSTLANHEVIVSAFEGIDLTQVWDTHVHLVGVGDTNSGIWLHPSLRNPLKFWRYIQFHFYLNASCPLANMPLDVGFIERLKKLHWRQGSRLMLLALDYTYDERGRKLPEKSAFYTPNHYVAQICKQNPELFEWFASIHPYRQDCVEALEQAVTEGAKGVKWLPPAMGMNPASPLCDRFYQALVRLNLPLLCHCGAENAVGGADTQAYGNPLALRRALDQGVKVIVAHCASLGSNFDIDKGQHGAVRSNFEFFLRLMAESRYEGYVFGDISALPQVNRVEPALTTLITHPEWHSRLLNGSDYPLPGIFPLFSLKMLTAKGFISSIQANVLNQLRRHNALLFDFVLKRHLQVKGQRFDVAVFHTRRHFFKST